jgi:anti-anti-sigma factor
MVAPVYPGFLAEEHIGDVTVVKFNQPIILDEDLIQRIGEQLSLLVEQSQHRQFVFDLGTVERLSTTLLGTFVAVYNRVRAGGGRMVLCGIDRNLRHIFTLFRLPQLFPICRDEQEALQTF